MEIIRKTMDINHIENTDLLPENTLFIDIETLGFNAAYHQIYLIGTAEIRDKKAQIVLYFAQSPGEESDILRAFLERTTPGTTLFTYNGDMFDIPFIKKRAAKAGILDALSSVNSLDLYKIVKRKKALLGLSGCKQKDVEQFLHLSREDAMSGGELIKVYKRYVKLATEEDRRLLVTHNLDDVKGMLRLLPMLSYDRLHAAEISDIAIDVNEAEQHVFLSAALSVSLPVDLRKQAEGAYVIISGSRIKCALRLTNGCIRYYYDNPKDYVYLLTEDTVIPKALADAVPKDAKRPAKAIECFSLVNVIEYPQPMEMYQNILKRILRQL